jgi:murein DD-endopeptidase MepM/ murein hydrolase activator NlpD
VTPEEVLAANGITRDDLHDGMTLFLPGVQHTGPTLWLVTGTLVRRPIGGWESSPFGWRVDPFTGARSFHTGVDIAAPMGSPIRSATIGTVVAATYDGVLGNYVAIRFNREFTYVYGHMSAIRTRVGARVEQGDLIGLVGDTGYATGPHVHFEIRQNGRPINPGNYVPGLR